MTDETMPVHVIQGQASLRSQALTSVLRLMNRKPLRNDSDGQELTPGADPLFLEFKVYREKPFSVFNIAL